MHFAPAAGTHDFAEAEHEKPVVQSASTAHVVLQSPDVVQPKPLHGLPPATPHVPSGPLVFFDAAHALHAPVHAVSQQTPPTQKPLAQSYGCAHAPPGAA
jgi:hypothetical protein